MAYFDRQEFLPTGNLNKWKKTGISIIYLSYIPADLVRIFPQGQ